MGRTCGDNEQTAAVPEAELGDDMPLYRYMDVPKFGSGMPSLDPGAGKLATGCIPPDRVAR